MSGPLKVCVCGGGEGTHALAGLAASCNEVETRILVLEEGEAEKWGNQITLTIHERNGNTRELKSKPRMVTSDAKEAVTGSDIVILVTSAHAHGIYLEAVAPHLGKNTLIVGLPGRPGFEFQCWNILGPGVYTIMSFEAFPWNCKITEYGKKAEISRTKEYLSGAMTRGRGVCRRPPLMSIQMLHGSEPLFRQGRHFLEILLTPYTFLNVGIIYGQWKDWDGKPVPEIPLFYESVTKETAELLAECSKEYLALAEAIKAAKPSADLSNVMDISQWLIENHRSDITDNKDLTAMITSNMLFKGVKHEMKEDSGGFTPDFEKMLSEEILAGLAVVKGIALVLGVDMPQITMLLQWGQEKLGKQLLVDGQLSGSDIESTKSPQRYGLNTLEAILTGKKEENLVD